MNDVTVRQTVLVITYITDKLVYACLCVWVCRLMMYVCMYVCRNLGAPAVGGDAANVESNMASRERKNKKQNTQKKNPCCEKCLSRISEEPTAKLNRFTHKFEWKNVATTESAKKNAGSTGTSRTLDGLRHTGEDETRFDCFAAVRSRDTGDWMSWWLDDILGHNNRIWPERDATRRLLRRGTINIHVTVSGCGWQIIFVALFNTQVEVNRDARRTTKELKAQREVNFWRTQLKK